MAEGFLPGYYLIELAAIPLTLAIIVGILVLRRSSRLDLPTLASGGRSGRSGWARSLFSTLFVDIASSRPLVTCNRTKWIAHLLVFWGFIFTLVATILALLLKPEGSILALTHPVKMFGNIGGAMIIGGGIPMFLVRFQESGSIWSLSRSDVFLLSLIFTTLTGFAVQLSIYAYGRGGILTGSLYWVHLAFIILLLGAAPFTKFIHAIYKPSWILYTKLFETSNHSRRAP